MRGDALLKWESRRSLQPVAERRVVDVQINGFRPHVTFGGIAGGSDDAAIGRPAVDLPGELDGTNGAHRLEDGFGEAGLLRPVQLVQIKTFCLPIFMNDQGKVKTRLAL